MSAEFAALAASRLTAGGVWRLATDWADYADAMRAVLDAAPGLVNAHDGWAPRFAERPVTKYEDRGLAAGRTVRDLSTGPSRASATSSTGRRTPAPHRGPL